VFAANSKNSTHSFDEPFSESLWTFDLSSLGLTSFDLGSLGLDSLGLDSLGFDSFDLGAATVDIFMMRRAQCSVDIIGIGGGWI
jgi:hypothetical protein